MPRDLSENYARDLGRFCSLVDIPNWLRLAGNLQFLFVCLVALNLEFLFVRFCLVAMHPTHPTPGIEPGGRMRCTINQ